MYLKVVSGVGLVMLLSGCNDDGIAPDPIARDYSSIFAPLPQTSIYPADNPFRVSKEILGELLFWDPILSGDQNVACASCHHPDFGWADGRPVSIGSDGIGLGPNRGGTLLTEFHSPTIINTAFTGMGLVIPTEHFSSGGFFWDLRVDTLEAQALQPLLSDIEMRGFNVPQSEIMNDIVMRLQSIPEYVSLFDDAFDDADAINETNILRAVATFERKIIATNSKFDQFLNGDPDVFTEQEIIGLNKFIDGGCARCHSGPMLSDNLIHADDIVIGNQAVRTPTLRNIGFTAPYMHDGSHTTLRAAIAAYEERDDLQVTLDESDFGDIERFLRTLDANQFYRDIPTSVPSGLPVGGDIQ